MPVRIASRSVWAAVLAVAAVSTVHARSLREQLGASSLTVGLAGGSAFDALAANIADSAARSLPVVSASAGFTYRYDRDLDTFVRTSDTLGPLFLERPDTLGQGKLNVNMSFQYVQLDAFDGDSIKKLEAPDPIVFRTTDPAGNLIGFTANRLRYGLKLQSYVTALSATYGALDDVDVNVLVPVIETNLDVGVHSQQVAIAGSDGDFGQSMLAPLSGFTHGTAVGVGDIQLRLKYRLSNTGPIRSAAGLQLRLPAGDENDFHGTGASRRRPSSTPPPCSGRASRRLRTRASTCMRTRCNEARPATGSASTST